MTLNEFRHALAALHHIDQQSWMGDAFWREFRDRPALAFMRADDEMKQRIWEMIGIPDED